MDIENMVLSREALADLLGLSPRRINQLSQEGVFPKVTHGKYKMLEAVHGYFAYLGADINMDFVEVPCIDGLQEQLDAIEDYPE